MEVEMDDNNATCLDLGKCAHELCARVKERNNLVQQKKNVQLLMQTNTKDYSRDNCVRSKIN